MRLPRTLAVATLIALGLPASAAALNHQTVTRYQRDYHAVVSKLGARAPGRNIVNDGLSSGRTVRNADLLQSIGVLERMLRPAPVVHRTAPTQEAVQSAPAPAQETVHSAPAPQTQPASSGGLSNVPGVPASFAACVAMRESSNGAGSSNIYGIIPASGYNVAGDSLAQQKQVFAEIYAKDGVSAWAPYDGC